MSYLGDILISKSQEIPPASYISHRGAVSIVLSSINQFKNSFSIPLDFSPKVLRLINEFLDYILLVFLDTSQSVDISCLRNAISNQLPTHLGVEAISEAEAELQAYIDNEPLLDNSCLENDQKIVWNLDDVWNSARAKCMLYSTLSDQEKENFPNNIWTDQLISPSVAIYITSILEFIAEHILLVTEGACRERLNQVKSSHLPMIEEKDLCKGLKYDGAIFSLWNRWKSEDIILDLKGNKDSLNIMSIITVPISFYEETNLGEKHLDNSDTEFTDASRRTSVNVEENINIMNTNDSNYIVSANKETVLSTPVLKTISMNTETGEKLFLNRKNEQNKHFYDAKLQEQINLNINKTENEIDTSKIVQYEMNINRIPENRSPLKRKIFRSLSCEEKKSTNISIIFKSDNEKILTNNQILDNTLNTNLLENIVFLEKTFKKSKSDSDISKIISSFLENTSISDDVAEDSLTDPFSTDMYSQFSNIILKNQSHFFIDEELSDQVQKCSLINNDKTSTFNTIENKGYEFFINNYNSSYINNYDLNLSCKKTRNSSYNKIFLNYKTLGSEQGVYNPPINCMNTDLKTLVYRKDKNIIETPSKPRNFSSSDLLSKRLSLKINTTSLVNEIEQNNSLILEISTLNNYLKANTLYQNTNILDFKSLQYEIMNKIENDKNNCFNNHINSNTTMKIFLNPDDLKEIDFDDKKSYMELCCQAISVPDILSPYNKELINRYCDTTKSKDISTFDNDIKIFVSRESPASESLSFCSAKSKQIKLNSQESIVYRNSDTNSLNDLSTNSINDIDCDKSLNSGLFVEYTLIPEPFNVDNFKNGVKKDSMKNSFTNKNDLDVLLKPYLKIHQIKKESLIEFLKNSELDDSKYSASNQNSNLSTNFVEFQNSELLDKKVNKGSLEKMQLFKESSVSCLKDDIESEKTNNNLNKTLSVYNKGISSKNLHQISESIEKKRSEFLDDISLKSWIFPSEVFDYKSSISRNSINYDINNHTNELDSNNYFLKTNEFKETCIEHKESLVDFLKNTSPVNHIEESFINDFYRPKKKRNIFFRWKKKRYTED
ncbi:hypothetical protein PCK1_003031 [Pneumocystis canis]|nr:hypothetical protein PCK1_003031 [Pneumocystis canis]